MWERWKCRCVAWTVPRIQSRHQGAASPLRDRPSRCGNGATFHLFSVLQLRNLACADKSGTEFLSRSGVVEAVQTPQSVTAGRCDKIFAYPDDGFVLDGTRDNHEFHHCIPRDQSAQTGEHYHSDLGVYTHLTHFDSWQTSLVD